MILHYLGLDHIGHTMGPKSPLVVEKLKEMDDVIKKIYHEFQTKKTAIIICGDHGELNYFQVSKLSSFNTLLCN